MPRLSRQEYKVREMVIFEALEALTIHHASTISIDSLDALEAIAKLYELHQNACKSIRLTIGDDFE